MLKLKLLIRRWFNRRVIVRNYTPLSDEELKGAFAVPEDLPLFKAFRQKLDDYIEDAADLSAMPETSAQHGLLAHTTGGLEQLRNFRRDILELRKSAWETPKEDPEKD